MTLLTFTPIDLERLLGPSYFQRAKSYYQQGRVKKIKISQYSILGDIKGSWEGFYRTAITLNHTGGISDSACSCSLGGYCKHVGAMGLKALEEMKKVKIEAPWLLKLKQACAPPSFPSKKQNHVQLAFNLEQGRSGAGSLKNKDYFRLVLRPRFFNARSQKYSLTELNWRGIHSKNEAFHTLLPESRQFLKKIADALTENNHWYAHSERWVALPNEKVDYLWHLLQQHEKCKVPLVCGTQFAHKVTVSSIPLRAELLLEEKGPDLTLRVQLMHEQEKWSPEEWMKVGESPVFVVHFKDPLYPNQSELTLHGLEGNSKSLQHFKAPLHIPQSHLQEFSQKFLPALARDYKVVNSSSKIILPEFLSPTLRVKVSRGEKNKVQAEFHLKYGEKAFPLDHRAHEIELEKGGAALCQPEQAEALVQNFKKQLSALPSLWNEEGEFKEKGSLERLEAAHFLNDLLADFKDQENIHLELEEDLPRFVQDTSTPELEFKVEENSQDWFDLNISIKVGENKIPFAQIFTALSKNEEHIFLEDGTYFALNHERFEKLRDMIREAEKIREVTPEGLSVSRFQASLWEELQKLGLVSQQAEAWEKAMQGLLNFKTIEAQIHSKKFKAQLRTYQKEGYHWLYFLYQHGLGGVLADDMGLGKTLQAIALLDHIKEVKKEKGALSLVVGPTSVVESWDMELEQFAPHLKRVVMRAGDRSQDFKALKKADVLITSYSLMQRDFELLKEYSFRVMILDEAQYLKNHQSKAYSAARKLKAHVRLALTGTPMENNTLELWSVFSIVAPGLFPSIKHFKNEFQKPIEKEGDQLCLDKLRSRIRPFIVRRKKELVAKDLPAKSEQVMLLEMDQKQRKIYDIHLQKERQRVLGLMKDGGMKQNCFEIFRSLTRMRQLCLHPGLVDKKHLKVPSVKLEQLAQKLEDILSEGHRALVFSQFTSFLAHVKEKLDQKGMDYLYLDGATKKRGALIRKFQEEKKPSVFLISLKAGGSGLTLTAADYCIMLDPWWNPAVEAQAIDRTHRIGQKKKVFVYKMIIKDSIEEKVLALQKKKQVLFDSVLEEGGKFGSAITEEDIRGIFED